MKKCGVTPTLSPSMDIQISSNFERYLFELLGHDSDHLSRLMQSFSDSGEFTIESEMLHKAQKCFAAYRLSDDQISGEIAHIYQTTGEIIDPHSVIGVSAAKQENDTSVPTIVLGTAHPAKFPDAIRSAIGVDVSLPSHLGNMMSKPEKVITSDNSLNSIKSIIENQELT